MSESKSNDWDRVIGFKSRKKIPVILQTELSECGLACLAMILGHYGYNCSLHSLRKRFSVSMHGMTLRHLVDMSNELSLSARPVKADLHELRLLSMPCILHWGMNHFVVLKKVYADKIAIVDPAVGEVIAHYDEISSNYTGVALELAPSKSFKKKKENHGLRFSDFWRTVRGLKGLLFQLVALSAFLQVFGLINPLYMQIVIDEVVSAMEYNLLLVLAMGFGLLLLFELLTRWLRQTIMLRVTSLISFQLSTNLFRHLLSLPVDYFERRHVGDVVSRFQSLQSLKQMMTNGIVSSIIDGAMVALTLIVMSFYSLKLTLVVVGFATVYAGIRWALFYPLRSRQQEQLIASANERSHFLESVRAIQTVKLFEHEHFRHAEWTNKMAHVLNKDISIAKWNINFNVLNTALFGLENILLVYFAAKSLMSGDFTIGMMFAFFAYKNRFVAAVSTLIDLVIEFKMMGVHIDRISDIVMQDSERVLVNNDELSVGKIEESAGQKYSELADKIQGAVEVRNLGFRYSELEKPVFQNINFSVAKGQTVVLTGPSGSGKTTLLKCLMGILEPFEGEVLIDGKPLRHIHGFRSQVAAVMQKDELLSGDIADNISCFDESVDIPKIVECAGAAQIHKEIEAMPMKYHTLVGDMGSTLSGGQKQRILLARALYKRPKMLFLDEATSHLDLDNEKRINSYIKGLNITRIVVAHREETRSLADKEIYIPDGARSTDLATL